MSFISSLLETMTPKVDVKENLNSIRNQLKDLEDKVDRTETDNGTPEDEEAGMMELLLRSGHENFLLTDPEVIRKLTEKRIELLKTVKEKEINSVKELADETDRSWANVSNDLDLLAKEGFIEFKREGKQKKPVLRAQKIFVKPIEL